MEGRADGENGMAVRADLCLVTGSPWTLGLSDGTMAGSAPRSLDRERPPGQAPRVFVLKGPQLSLHPEVKTAWDAPSCRGPPSPQGGVPHSHLTSAPALPGHPGTRPHHCHWVPSRLAAPQARAHLGV